MFADIKLEETLAKISLPDHNCSKLGRALNLSEQILLRHERETLISGIGGFPIRQIGDDFTIIGAKVTPETIQKNLLEALGYSGILTHLKAPDIDPVDFGQQLLAQGHTWAFRAIPFTLLFVNKPAFVELSFLRHGAFSRGGSWVETPIISLVSPPFTIVGSLKDWKSYCYFKDSKDFLKSQREAIQEVDKLFSDVLGVLWAIL